MFTVYQKLITPETSPVLGPINTTPRESPTITPKEDPQTSASATTSEPTPLSNMEPFSLCNYCCSPRPKPKHDTNKAPQPDPIAKPDLYEFGHATHYKYNATTPRMICEFETGTPP